MERVKDLVGVVRQISAQDWNKDKLGVVGFSQGAPGVNLLANTREIKRTPEVRPSDLHLFGAVVSHNPRCAIAGGAPPDLPYLPVIVRIAMSDGLADSFWCQSGYRKNENLTIYKYDGAPHGFEMEVPGWRKNGPLPVVNRRYVN